MSEGAKEIADVVAEMAQTSWQHAQDHHQSDFAMRTPKSSRHKDRAPILRFSHMLHAEEDAGQGMFPCTPNTAP